AIKETLAKYQINANKIELEITESVVISNPKYTITLLNKLRDIGFAIALDDFGTGYSSLSDLKQLPVSKLKIDKSFVDDLPDGENDKVITQSIISLSNAMNMEALAEGIETQGQMDFLIQNGCGLGQGYLFSKPLPLKHLIDWLNTQA
ncbi:MAG TPA: EAL domain-containing protein, partial [Thiomicrospira sp.]|nr:EAL domain-containing protein [Thiomicrospira sp.]